MASRIAYGLLPDEQSLLPSMGLLAAAAGKGRIPQALAQMAAQRAAPPAEDAAPAPAPRPAMPAPAPMATEPQAPLMTPAKAGFLSGGIAALEAGPGSAYSGPGPVIAAALKAGLSTYMAGKQDERATKAEQAQTEAYRAMLEDPAVAAKLGPVKMKFAQSLRAGQGIPFIQKELEHETKFTTKGRDQELFADGVKIADAGPETITADGVVYERSPSGQLVPQTKKTLNVDASKDFNDAAVLEGLDPEKRGEFTPQERARVAARMAAMNTQRRSPGTVVNVGQKSYVDSYNEKMIGEFSDQHTKALAAPKVVGSINRALQTLDDPTFTGFGADLRLNLTRIANALGFTDADKITNTQVLQSELKNQLVTRVKELGVNPSDADLKALESAIGSRTMTPEALRDILEQARNLSVKHVEGVNDWNRKIRENAPPGSTVVPVEDITLPDPPTFTVRGPKGETLKGRTLPDGRRQLFWDGKWHDEGAKR